MKKSTHYCLAGLLCIPLAAIADDNTFAAKGIVYTYPVTIDGNQYTFILDFAGATSFVNPYLASKLQYLVAETANTKSTDKADKKPVFITVPEIQIGNQTVKQVQLELYYPADPAADPGADPFLGFQVDGILGMNIYQQFIWEMDNKNKKLKVHAISDSSPKNHYQQCIHYQLDKQHYPVITNIIKDKPTFPFRLSTSSVVSAIDPAAAKTLHLMKETIPGTDKKQDLFYYYKDLQIANVPVKQYLTRGATIDGYPGGAFLGLDFFSRFDQFRIDPSNNSLCFNHFDASKKLFRYLSLQVDNGKITLSADNYSGFLKKTGLEKGDIIVSINNTIYSPEQITIAKNVLLYSKSLDLEINRNGKISHIIINADDA